MATKTRGVFTLNPSSGQISGVAEISVPANNTFRKRTAQFKIFDEEHDEPVKVFCVQVGANYKQELDIVYKFEDRGINDNDGTNVRLVGRICAYVHNTNTIVQEYLTYTPTIKIGYIDSSNVKHVVLTKTLGKDFKYEDYTLLIPISEYEQSSVFMTFDDDSTVLEQSYYKYYRDIYSTSSIGVEENIEFYTLYIEEYTEQEVGDNHYPCTNIKGYIQVRDKNAEIVANPAIQDVYISLIKYVGPDANNECYQILSSYQQAISLRNPVGGKVAIDIDVPGYLFDYMSQQYGQEFKFYVGLTFNKSAQSAVPVVVEGVNNGQTVQTLEGFEESLTAITHPVVNNIHCYATTYLQVNPGQFEFYGYNASDRFDPNSIGIIRWMNAIAEFFEGLEIVWGENE